ncbi:MAG: radical SAM protein [Bacillota bacterium]
MGYVDLHRSGELSRRADALEALLEPCRVCPRACMARRLSGERGQCGAGSRIEISGYGPHFGEEPPLVGRGGSGTIFFAFCSLYCVYCQNYETSRGLDCYQISCDELAAIMVELQRRGCENINLVTPTHFVPQIVRALDKAASLGLTVPIVYNSSGYEALSTLRLLDGVVDIYLPDVKYADEGVAMAFSRVQNYPSVAKAALKEMYRQVGDLAVDEQGVAKRGLLVRHLVLPGNLAGTEEVMRFIASEVSASCWINIMDQYYPTYMACRYPELNRKITSQEHQRALAAARRASAKFRIV